MRSLDPHPGEWSFPLFTSRAVVTLIGERYFYEPIFQYDDLLSVSLLNDRLLDAAVLVQHIEQMEAVLDVFPSMWTAPAGRLPLPESDESSIGRHAVALDGYDDRGESLVFANSYGVSWGDDGYGSFSREYGEMYMREAWASRRGACGPTNRNYERIFREQLTARPLLEAWYEENKAVTGRYWLGNRRYDYRTYDTLSLGSGCVVDVVEMRLGTGKERQGWAHIYYPGGSDLAIIRELFVVPEARRRRVGTALERVIAEKVATDGRRELHLDLHEADAFGDSEMAARAFMRRRGYAVAEDLSVPGIATTGVKQLD